MKVLSKNKVLITLFALFMGLCTLLGIFATAPRAAKADEAPELSFVESSDKATALLPGGLYRIKKADGTFFNSAEEISLTADGFTCLTIDIESGYVMHECGSSSCGQVSKVSKIINLGPDLAYVDVSMPGQYRCVCGDNSSIKDTFWFVNAGVYSAYHLTPEVDLAGVSFLSAKDVCCGGVWVKMNFDEFYEEADGSYYIDCYVMYGSNGFDTVLRIRVSDVFCVFVDTYKYLHNYSLYEMEPITKYKVMDDSVVFYLPSSYEIFYINEKVVEGPTDGPNGDNESNLPEDGEKLEEEKTFGDWINGIGDTISGWLGENTGIAISSSAAIIIIAVILFFVFRKKR